MGRSGCVFAWEGWMVKGAGVKGGKGEFRINSIFAGSVFCSFPVIE